MTVKETGVSRETGCDNIDKNSQGPELVTVLFVPGTPGGQLATQLKEAEKVLSGLTNERVRIVERGGTTVKSLLVKSNPWVLPAMSKIESG